MPRSDNLRPLPERPYAERQLIVVARDEVVEAALEAERELKEQKNGVNWTRIGEVATNLLIGSTADLALEITKRAIEAWSRARESGIDVLQVSASEAEKLEFPPGHPRDGVLYIGHPATPNVYYTMAEFHRVTFEHKFADAVRLLMQLGATKIQVEHVTGWSKDFSGRISIPLGAAGESGAVEASGKGREQTKLLYEATLTGTTSPKVPDNLVWYPHEATWQAVTEGRLNFGLREFSLSIAYEDDFGVNAGLRAAVQKVGLDIGGSFEDHQSTVWRLDGTFAPIE